MDQFPPTVALNDPDDEFEYFFDAPGSEPGTLWIEADARPSELNAIAYTKQNAEVHANLAPEDCRSLLESPAIAWVDVRGLGSEDVLRQLGSIFELHPLLLEDVVNAPQRPKVEDYRKQLLAIARTVSPRLDDHGKLAGEQIGFVLGKGYLLTFQEDPDRECFGPVRDRLRTNKGKVRKSGADYLLYLLLDSLIDSFFPVLETYGDRIEDLETEVAFHAGKHTLQNIYRLRRELLALRRAIWPLQSVVTTLMRSGSSLVGTEVEVYFRDCYDHVLQLLEIVENYRELSSSLMDAYRSSVEHRTNEVVRLLTVVTSIFTPLTFLAGVYGMNFRVMPELDWRYGYYICLALMAAIAGGLLWFFWRRGWLTDSLPGAVPPNAPGDR